MRLMHLQLLLRYGCREYRNSNIAAAIVVANRNLNMHYWIEQA